MKICATKIGPGYQTWMDTEAHKLIVTVLSQSSLPDASKILAQLVPDDVEPTEED